MRFTAHRLLTHTLDSQWNLRTNTCSRILLGSFLKANTQLQCSSCARIHVTHTLCGRHSTIAQDIVCDCCTAMTLVLILSSMRYHFSPTHCPARRRHRWHQSQQRSDGRACECHHCPRRTAWDPAVVGSTAQAGVQMRKGA